ncbi:transposase [Streptomyces globisporus]|uniref:transposase n=1 Tax=Streptomyces globisporus TaxID=1908 RepID=UPI003864B38C
MHPPRNEVPEHQRFTPFLRFDTEIRRIVCTTNAIESVNARIRRAVKARRALPERTGRPEVRLHGDHVTRPQARWTMHWKTALNAFHITLDGRLSVVRQ